MCGPEAQAEKYQKFYSDNDGGKRRSRRYGISLIMDPQMGQLRRRRNHKIHGRILHFPIRSQPHLRPYCTCHVKQARNGGCSRPLDLLKVYGRDGLLLTSFSYFDKNIYSHHDTKNCPSGHLPASGSNLHRGGWHFGAYWRRPRQHHFSFPSDIHQVLRAMVIRVMIQVQTFPTIGPSLQRNRTGIAKN